MKSHSEILVAGQPGADALPSPAGGGLLRPAALVVLPEMSLAS